MGNIIPSPQSKHDNVEEEVMSQHEPPSIQTSLSSISLKNTLDAMFACPPPDDVRHIEQVDWGDLQPKTIRHDPCGCTAPSPGLLCCIDESCVLFACQEECDSNCVAQCGNSRIRNKQWKRVQVFDAGQKKGRGLRALEPIQKGEFIIEYVGKAIQKKDLESLFESYQMERMHYLMSLDGDIYIDARKSGGLARYINHSCQPNCKLDRWKVSGVTRAVVFATADIPTGGELTIDYKWIRKRGRPPTFCYCQSSSCRGTLELSKTKEESEFNEPLKGHWTVPKSIQEEDLVNRTIKIFVEVNQEYFVANVCKYDSNTRKHFLFFQYDAEESWEDLSKEKWMILDEEGEEEFTIKRKQVVSNNHSNNDLPVMDKYSQQSDAASTYSQFSPNISAQFIIDGKRNRKQIQRLNYTHGHEDVKKMLGEPTKMSVMDISKGYNVEKQGAVSNKISLDRRNTKKRDTKTPTQNESWKKDVGQGQSSKRGRPKGSPQKSVVETSHSSAQFASSGSRQFTPINANLLIEKCTAIPIPGELLVPNFSEQFPACNHDTSSELFSDLSLVSRLVQYKHAVGDYVQAQFFCLQGLQHFRQQGLTQLKRQQDLVSARVSEVVECSVVKSRVPLSEFPLDCEIAFAQATCTVCGLWVLYATLLGQCKGEFFNLFDPTSSLVLEQAELLKNDYNELLSLKNLFQDLESVFRDLKRASLTPTSFIFFRLEGIVYEYALCCPVAKLTSSIWIACARFCLRASAKSRNDDTSINTRNDDTSINTVLEATLQKGKEALDNFVPNSTFFVQWKDNAIKSSQNVLQSLLLCDKNKTIADMECPSSIRYWQSEPLDVFSTSICDNVVDHGNSGASVDLLLPSDDVKPAKTDDAVCNKNEDRGTSNTSLSFDVMSGSATSVDLLLPSDDVKTAKTDDAVCGENEDRGTSLSFDFLSGSATSECSSTLLSSFGFLTGSTTSECGSTLLSFAEALSTSSTLSNVKGSCESVSRVSPSKERHSKNVNPSVPIKPILPHTSLSRSTLNERKKSEFTIKRLRF